MPTTTDPTGVLFAALGDPQRLRLLRILIARRTATVTELTAAGSVTQPTVSHHLRLLTAAGLATVSRRGVWRVYAPTDTARSIVRAADRATGRHDLPRSA